MAVKLHRCKNVWVKFGGHPCWRVQKALDDASIEYELVTYGWPDRKREDVQRATGQSQYPVIQFEDGSVYREESADMAETIRSGRLYEKRAAQSRES